MHTGSEREKRRGWWWWYNAHVFDRQGQLRLVLDGPELRQVLERHRCVDVGDDHPSLKIENI